MLERVNTFSFKLGFFCADPFSTLLSLKMGSRIFLRYFPVFRGDPKKGLYFGRIEVP